MLIMNSIENLSMLMDFYELTMVNGLFKNDMQDKIVYFDMFFRKVPDNGGYVIFAGLEQLIDYIKNLSFSEEDLEYLKSKGVCDEKFIDALRNFKFKCDIWSVPEGTVVFPQEPLITVRGPVFQAQLIETMLLLIINHQSLIATKANRIVRAANGREVMEFGARRAQGASSSIYGARAAYIGGCSSTSNAICDLRFNIKAVGTMAHSWVQLFDNELDAFKAYARAYPDKCMLLVDTYDTLKSGLPNAIKTFNEEVLTRGCRPIGIRIDSGDISYLSIKAREMLDEAGFEDSKICVSNSLDEHIIKNLLEEGAKIDSFGVGEKLITSASDPTFGGVYKLCAVEKNDGSIEPKIKISNNVSKVTIPGVKSVWRLYDRSTNKSIADLITLREEVINDNEPYMIFDPDHPWKKKIVENFRAVDIRKQIFKNGQCIYDKLNIDNIREYAKDQVNTLWEEVTRFKNPHTYYVDLSEKLWTSKNKIISDIRSIM